MKKSRALCALFIVFALAACGGGGGGGKKKGATPAPSTPPAPTTPAPTTPTPDVRLVISSSPIAVTLAYGDDTRASVAGRWTATNLGSAQVFLQVSDNNGAFVTPPVAASSNPDFSYELPVSADVVPGTRAGIITVRACEDVQCVKPYANASQTLAYTVVVTPMPEWETTQGNAAHNAYVPITLDVAKFAKAWEWNRPTTGVIGGINAVATVPGLVMVTEDEYAGQPWLYALREKTGETVWKQQFALNLFPHLNPPATSDGKVFVTTTGHSSTFLWAFDAKDGRPLLQTSFQTQWAQLLAPTIFKGTAYVNSGYFGGVVYSFDAASGQQNWAKSGGTYGMNTPAVDDTFVYVHNSSGLSVFGAQDGALVASIGGTSSGGVQTDYHGAAAIGSHDNILAYMGDALSGRAASSAEPSASRNLRNYSPSTLSVRWTSQKGYKTYPAIANGVVYVASDNPKSFDALDEKTGAVLWSWIPGPSDVTFHRNVVVTNNLVFVSTNRGLYALDLKTHQPVWQTDTPGQLSISGSRMLLVAVGTALSNGKLVAYRTR